jgi:hydroxymethylpyrimidine pyrophosphatase-like HAD family hydrolase
LGLHYALLCENEANFTIGNPRIGPFDLYAGLCEKYNFPVPERRSIAPGGAGLVKEEVYKILICAQEGEGEWVNDLKDYLDKNGSFSYARSGFGIFDITAAGTDKGEAIELIANHYKVPMNEVCAFGDYDNDLEIFERVGLSVAMENSSPKLKAAADLHTYSNEEDGIAHALEILQEYF